MSTLRIALRLLREISPREIRTHRARFALYFTSLALGSAMVSSMQIASDAAKLSFAHQIDRIAGAADLQVLYGTGETPFSEEIIDHVNATQGVQFATALVRGRIRLLSPPFGSLEVFGVDLAARGIEAVYGAAVREPRPSEAQFVGDPNVVLLSAEFAERFNLAAGAEIVAGTPSGTRTLKVVGEVDTAGVADTFNGRVALMYLPAAQLVLGKTDGTATSLVDQIDVVLDGKVREEAVARALRARIPHTLIVEKPLARKQRLEHALDGLAATLKGISWFVMLAAVFIVYSTTAALVHERLPALTTIGVLGVPSSSIALLVVVEACLIGIAASAVGTAAGVPMGIAISEDVRKGMELNYWIRIASDTNPFSSPRLLATQPLVGGLVAALATVGPALKIRKLSAVEPRNVGFAVLSTFHSAKSIRNIGIFVCSIGAALIYFGTARPHALAASLGSLVAVFGATTIAISLLGKAWERIAPSLRRLRAVEGLLSSANLQRDLSRNSLIVAGIALCVAVSVGAATLPESFRRSGWTWYGFSGDVVVTSRTAAGGWLGEPIARSRMDALRTAMPGVSLETLRVATGQPFHDARIAIVAVTPGYRRAIGRAAHQPASNDEDGADWVPNHSHAAVSANLARRFGIRIDDRIAIPSPAGPLKMKVGAIVPDYVSDTGSIIVSDTLYRREWRDDTVTLFSISATQDQINTNLREDIERLLADDHDLLVLSSEALRERTDQSIATAFADLNAIQGLLVVVTLVATFEYFASSVLSRRREFALLRGVGVSQSMLRSSTTLEATVLGAAAGIIGVLVGVFFSYIWIRHTYPTLVGYVLDLHLSYSAIGASLLLSCGVAAATTSLVARYLLSRARNGEPLMEDT